MSGDRLRSARIELWASLEFRSVESAPRVRKIGVQSERS
jgi:hypothetical protein